MTIEDDIISEAARQMAHEIDKEILEDLMWDAAHQDWTFVDISEWSLRYTAAHLREIIEWCQTYIGEYSLRKQIFVFKDPKDATLFILKWS